MTPYFQLVALPCTLNMLSMSTSLSVDKVVFMADRIMIIPILGKLPFVGTPFITEDGCSGSDMASNKCLPSAIPDESQNGSSGLPVDLQHPKDPLPFTAPSVATSTTMILKVNKKTQILHKVWAVLHFNMSPSHMHCQIKNKILLIIKS